MARQGIVICGPEGSGRGELAAGLVRALGDAGIRAAVLDGEEIARRLWPEAEGPAPLRLAWLAAFLGRAGVEAVVLAGPCAPDAGPLREAGLKAPLLVDLASGPDAGQDPLHLAPGPGCGAGGLLLVLERLQALGRLEPDAPAPYAPDEEELVRRRLEALGYL